MPARLGIFTRYRRSEGTTAALQLADTAEACGVEATVLSRDGCSQGISSHWDARVVPLRKHVFLEWAHDCDRIIWLTPPTAEEVGTAQKLGVETCGFMLRTDMPRPTELQPYRSLDRVFILARDVISPLRRAGVRRSYDINWTVDVPVTRPWPISVEKPVRFLIPCYYCDRLAASRNFMHGLALLLRSSDAEVTVVVNRAGQRRRLRGLLREFSSRLNVVCCPEGYAKWALFAQHHFTIWPEFDVDTGDIGHTSLHLGLPVLSWASPSRENFLTHELNAMLVRCDVSKDWLGMPHYRGDLRDLFTVAAHVAHNAQLQLQLRRSVSHQLKERRQHFLEHVRQLLP